MSHNAGRVLLAIDRAFPKRHCPSEIDASLKREDQSPEGYDASQLLIGKAWHEIDCQDFEYNYPSPFMIDPSAMEYYFPGLLRCAVLNPDSSLASGLIPFRLVPPKRDGKFSDFASRYAWMTREQKGAVVAFLTHFKNSTSAKDERRRRQIDDAIRRFWGIPV